MTIRLLPGDDLKESILKFIFDSKVGAASIVTCVGSVSSLRIRLAGYNSKIIDSDKDVFEDRTNKYEITSLVGTLEYRSNTNDSYGHLHIAVSDHLGHTFGGHLLNGTIVHTTAEITVLNSMDVVFDRILCASSGYRELVVLKQNAHQTPVQILSSSLSSHSNIELDVRDDADNWRQPRPSEQHRYRAVSLITLNTTMMARRIRRLFSAAWKYFDALLAKFWKKF
jgi:predicted DNA-binding protein with PD1-like motif